MIFKEIQELHKFCVEHKIKHDFHTFNDWGYQIRFRNGDDCVQHRYSYECENTEIFEGVSISCHDDSVHGEENLIDSNRWSSYPTVYVPEPT